MATAHRQRRITSPDLDRASDLEREAIMLVERVDRRIQELREQRSGAGDLPTPPGGAAQGGSGAAVVGPARLPTGG